MENNSGILAGIIAGVIALAVGTSLCIVILLIASQAEPVRSLLGL